MPIKKNKISFFYDLSDQLDGSSRSEKQEIKKRAGEVLLGEIMDFTARSNSPVAGKGSFKSLSSSYKKIKKSKGKGTAANLRLNEDMLPSLRVNQVKDGIEIVITESLEKKKAFNHITGDTLPQRAFLPNDDEGQDFKRNIKAKVKRSISEIKTINTEFEDEVVNGN